MNCVLLDIEGTIASISFVKEVLFPYSKKNISSHLESLSKEEVERYIHEANSSHFLPEKNSIKTVKDLEKVLLMWINEDVKDSLLKSIQGQIWDTGYKNGELKAPLYGDVVPFLDRCHKKNIGVSIYSSGSVKAQKLFFKYNEKGDLTENFRQYFDTNIGQKQDENSYLKIAEALKVEPHKILFYSDCKKEIAAAQKVGVNTILVDRESASDSLHDSHSHCISHFGRELMV